MRAQTSARLAVVIRLRPVLVADRSAMSVTQARRLGRMGKLCMTFWQDGEEFIVLRSQVPWGPPGSARFLDGPPALIGRVP